MTKLNVSEAITFQASTKENPFAKFGLAANVSQRDVEQLIVRMERSTDVDEHKAFGAAIVPPIALAVPYVEMYNIFFQDITYGDLEDNTLPVEKDVIALAWETHAEGEIMFTSPGLEWTRPSFTEWDTGVEIPWRVVRRTGWNVLQRTLARAAEALARKRDAQKKAAIDAAVTALSGHTSTVSGGTMTKASVDGILQDAADIGFPITIALANPGRLMDMAVNTGWTWGSTGFNLSPQRGEQLITTMYLGDYGGVQWYANPHCSTSYVYFGGPASETGYHQVRGDLQTASDVNIVRKVDLHTIMDAEHAVYVGNSYRLWRLQITS